MAAHAREYENFIKIDFMEYDLENAQGNDHVYSGSLINCYSSWGLSCGEQFCTIKNSHSSKIRQIRGMNISSVRSLRSEIDSRFPTGPVIALILCSFVMCAWLYVVLRVAHSLVQATGTRIVNGVAIAWRAQCPRL